MVHFCAKLIRAEDSSAVTQPRRDRTHYLHGAWLRTQGNAVVHIRLAGSVLRIVTDHLPDLQCFEFWFGGLQKSFQHLRLLSRAYHGERQFTASVSDLYENQSTSSHPRADSQSP